MALPPLLQLSLLLDAGHQLAWQHRILSVLVLCLLFVSFLKWVVLLAHLGQVANAPTSGRWFQSVLLHRTLYALEVMFFCKYICLIAWIFLVAERVHRLPILCRRVDWRIVLIYVDLVLCVPFWLWGDVVVRLVADGSKAFQVADVAIRVWILQYSGRSPSLTRPARPSPLESIPPFLNALFVGFLPFKWLLLLSFLITCSSINFSKLESFKYACCANII